MSTEFVFEKAIFSSSPEGVFLKIKLPFESRDAARNFVDNYKRETKHVCILKEMKAKRTLDQNGYFWVLCGELSKALKTPPKDIYREYIKDIGGNYEVTPIKEERVKRWVEIWEAKGVGFVAEDLGESKFKGYHNIRNYYGSSTYDKEQMSRLLDLIIADCEDNGIVTLTPEEISKMEC